MFHLQKFDRSCQYLAIPFLLPDCIFYFLIIAGREEADLFPNCALFCLVESTGSSGALERLSAKFALPLHRMNYNEKLTWTFAAVAAASGSVWLYAEFYPRIESGQTQQILSTVLVFWYISQLQYACPIALTLVQADR